MDKVPYLLLISGYNIGIFYFKLDVNHVLVLSYYLVNNTICLKYIYSEMHQMIPWNCEDINIVCLILFITTTIESISCLITLCVMSSFTNVDSMGALNGMGYVRQSLNESITNSWKEWVESLSCVFYVGRIWFSFTWFYFCWKPWKVCQDVVWHNNVLPGWGMT